MAPIVTIMCRLIYRVIMFLAQPGILVILGYRRLTGKEDKKRQRERLGYPTCTRPTGSLIWCHAASIGESLSILPLIIRLLERYPDLTILVTTCTVTSASVLAQRLPDRAIHHYIPFRSPDVYYPIPEPLATGSRSVDRVRAVAKHAHGHS